MDAAPRPGGPCVTIGRMTAEAPASTDIIAIARDQVLEEGVPLREEQLVEVLRTGDDRLEELLALAHEVRLRYQGPDIEVEGIASLKTGGCPEDCHFCSQSGMFTSPVRSVWLNIPELVRAAKQTRETGASEFCIVAGREAGKTSVHGARKSIFVIALLVELLCLEILLCGN